MEFSTKVLHSKSVKRFDNVATLPPIAQVSAFSYASAEGLEKVFANKAPGFAYIEDAKDLIEDFVQAINNSK